MERASRPGCKPGMACSRAEASTLARRRPIRPEPAPGRERPDERGGLRRHQRRLRGGRAAPVGAAACARRNGGALLDCGTTTGTGLAALGIERDEIDTHPGLALPRRSLRRHPRCCCSPRSTRTSGASPCASRVRPASSAACTSSRPRWATRSRSATGPSRSSSSSCRPSAPLEIGPVQVCSFETHHQPHTHPHGMVVTAGRAAHRLLGRHGLVRRSAAPGLPASDLFICECTYARRRLRVPPQPRGAGGAQARVRLRAHGPHPPRRGDERAARRVRLRDGGRRPHDPALTGPPARRPPGTISPSTAARLAPVQRGR